MCKFDKKINFVTCFFRPETSSSNSDINEILTGPQQARLLCKSFHEFSSIEKGFFISNQSGGCSLLTDIILPSPNDNELTLGIIRYLKFFFKNTSVASQYFIVCDPDVLLISSGIEKVFDGSFDIGITMRTDKRMPFNSGVFFVDNSRLNSGEIFYKLQEEIIDKKYRDYVDWFCDQLVIEDLMSNRSQKIGNNLYKIDELIVKVFDSQIYNYSPKRDHPFLLNVPFGVVLYHFKGRCRNAMPLFYQYFVKDKSKNKFKFLKYIIPSIYVEIQRKKIKKLFLVAKGRILPSDRKS